MPTGDFVVGSVASVVAAIVVVSAGVGIARVGAKLRRDQSREPAPHEDDDRAAGTPN